MSKKAKYRGKIVYFDFVRGFGFIKCSSISQDIFFHVKEIRNEFTPNEGLAVEFNYKKIENDKYRATEVFIIGGTADAD